jgi:C4-type Zn-finger protein
MRRSIVCPSCGSGIERVKVTALGPFPCPNCAKLLRISRLYYSVPMFGALPLCAVVGYLLGLRFITLVFFVLLL